MQPRDVGAFASQWRAEVKAAQRLGRRVGAERYVEVRYEELVEDVESVLRRIVAFAGCHTSRQWRITQATSTSRQSPTSRASGSRRRPGCATGACRCPRRTSVRSTALRAISWTSSATSRTSGPVGREGQACVLRRTCSGLAGGQLRAAALAAMAPSSPAPALTSSLPAVAWRAGARGSAGSAARATPSRSR